MKLKALFLLLLIINPAYGFEFEGGEIDIPSQFEGPTIGNMSAQAKAYGFKKTHEDGKTGTLLQLTVFNPGSDFPSLTNEELKKHSKNYLLQFLTGVEKRRSNFTQTSPTYISISGIPVAKIHWSGSDYGRKMEGIMYCYLYHSKIISLHTQDFIEYKSKYINQAIKAFENIKINR